MGRLQVGGRYVAMVTAPNHSQPGLVNGQNTHASSYNTEIRLPGATAPQREVIRVWSMVASGRGQRAPAPRPCAVGATGDKVSDLLPAAGAGGNDDGTPKGCSLIFCTSGSATFSDNSYLAERAPKHRAMPQHPSIEVGDLPFGAAAWPAGA